MLRFAGAVLYASIAFAFFATVARAADPPQLPETDRIRLAEVFRLADKIGNRVWPNWDKAAFAVLLVTPEHEFLLRHPKPTDDFTKVGVDPVLKEDVWVRKRKFSPQLLATFPAVNGVPTIVIGQAENTEAKTSTRWVITLLHEHFHQLQWAQPRYIVNVDGLGLAKGDMTGMWMLNFPFPYADAEVKEQFKKLRESLAAALQARRKPEFVDTFAAYMKAREKFRSLLKDDDWKYFGFQLWQEGIARYTECQLANLAAAEYEPSATFRQLKDYKPFKAIADELHDRIAKELDSGELDKMKRVVVYNFGAAEGLVLDEARPDWRKRYFEDGLSLDRHFRPTK